MHTAGHFKLKMSKKYWQFQPPEICRQLLQCKKIIKITSHKSAIGIIICSYTFLIEKVHCQLKMKKKLAEVIHINFAKMSTVTHLVMTGRHSYDT